MHAEKREEVDRAEAGDIVAVMGIDAASGDTYASLRDYCTLEGVRSRARHWRGCPHQ